MKLAPIDADTEDKVCSLKTDHHELKDWWLLTDSYEIEIYQQRSGESPKQKISIPKAKFDALIRWYLKPQDTVERDTP